MRSKSDLQRWGARVVALLAGGAIAGTIAMLAFAPRSGASTGSTPSPSLINTGTAIFVANPYCNSVTTYTAGASGNVAPLSPGTALCAPAGVAVDSKGNSYVANLNSNTVTVYPAGSNGNIGPSSIIGGSNTGLAGPTGVALDAIGNIYVSNYYNTVTVYPAGSNGNVAPSSTIGGSNSGLSASQGIALDAGGNIYVTNQGSQNGGVDTVTVYPAGSNGNVAPSSTIGGSNTGLNSPEGISLDAKGNIYVANTGTDTVTVYAAGSNGNVAPSATIGGANTGLNVPVGIALDGGGNIHVTNAGSANGGGVDTITVYAAGSNGNVAPGATIAGAVTGLNSPEGIALDGGGSIYVANAGSNNGGSDTLTVYPKGSNGNVAPSSTIGGPITGLDSPEGIGLDAGGNIYVTNAGSLIGETDTVTVYPPGSSANVAPSSTIGGSNTGLDIPDGIALGTNGSIYVTNYGNATVTVYSAGSNGNVAPSSTIDGSKTRLDTPTGIALDAKGKIYITNAGSQNGGTDTVTVYPAGSKGNVAPSATIGGSKTGLNNPVGIALDASGKIYVANVYGPTVTVYPAGSKGNVAPSATIGGPNTGLDYPDGIALDAGGNIYVANYGSNTVTVYSAGSKGNATPSAIIAGLATELASPAGIAIGPEQAPAPAVAAALKVSSKSLSFPATLTLPPSGATSASQALTLTNSIQNSPIEVEAGFVSGPGAAEFNVEGATSGCNVLPTQIHPGSNCVLDVTFTPNAVGAQTATLTVTTNSKTTPTLTIALKGVGKAASLGLAPGSINFPKTTVGQPSTPETVTLTNSNAAPLTLTYSTSFAVGGINKRSFSIGSNSCSGGTLSAGQSCTFQVTFTPQAKGKQSATISITDNAAKSPQVIKLSGTGG